MQLIKDLGDCRSKYAPEKTAKDSDPKKNAFDECLKGARAKNSWCLTRKPNNPAATVAFKSIDASPTTVTTTSATVTFEHKNPTAISVYWYATVYDANGVDIADLSVGVTPNVAAGVTTLTLPLTGVPMNATDIAVFGCHTVSTNDLGVGDGTHAWLP